MDLMWFLRFDAMGQCQAVPATFQFPQAVRAAHLLYAQPDYRRLRDEIEMRILAGKSPQTVGQAVSLPLAVIQTYEQNYFDIRDRLDCQEYIVSYAIGDLSQPTNAMKKLAYFAGHMIIDVLMSLYDIFCCGASDVGELRAALESDPAVAPLMKAETRWNITTMLESVCCPHLREDEIVANQPARPTLVLPNVLKKAG